MAIEGGCELLALVGVDASFPEEMLLSRVGTAGEPSDTIFMPRLVLVLAGMNKVVELSGPGMAIRGGWFELQHPDVSCVPVEYSCSASQRSSRSFSTSVLLKERSNVRTSVSERTVSDMFVA